MPPKQTTKCLAKSFSHQHQDPGADASAATQCPVAMLPFKIPSKAFQVEPGKQRWRVSKFNRNALSRKPIKGFHMFGISPKGLIQNVNVYPGWWLLLGFGGGSRELFESSNFKYRWKLRFPRIVCKTFEIFVLAPVMPPWNFPILRIQFPWKHRDHRWNCHHNSSCLRNSFSCHWINNFFLRL